MSTSLTIKPKIKRNKAASVLFWSPECKYEVILNNVKELNRDDDTNATKEESSSSTAIVIKPPKWELLDDEKSEAKANIYWIDVSSIHERFRSIQPWQIINHFPGMPNIARKNRMGQNLNKMLKLFPKEYAFYPRTWVLPGEINDFRQQFDSQGNALSNKIFIIKPDTGCQGRGIFLTRTFDNVPQGENVVAQLYIKKPLLLDGFKFDLRIYCFVSSVKPLRIYLFQDGLVRMCTEEYEKPTKQNISMACMHLTNYAVNKHNSNFQQPSAQSSGGFQDDASKRSLQWFMNYVSENHGDSKAAWLWRRIGTLCVRTILSVMPTLSREYDQHFKSFTGIPTVVPEYTLSSSAFNSDNNITANVHPNMMKSSSFKGLGKDSRRASTQSSTNTGQENNSSEDNNISHEEDDDHKHDVDMNNNASNTTSSTNNTSENNHPKPSNYPQMRGSRSFEVLGFDIMIDSNLKPWIIEVNHLPSFGTDSPLDLDIKDRLMNQVLQCVAALPDDEQAYINHHKAEASKRLVETKTTKSRDPSPSSQPAAKKPPAVKKPTPQAVKVKPGVAEETTTKTKSKPVLMVEPFDMGYCLPERFDEIKKAIIEIYEKHCPDKINKIDRLLAKYEFREEEFLKYIYGKYGITPPWVLAQEEYQRSVDAEKLEAEKLEAEVAAMIISNDENEATTLSQDILIDVHTTIENHDITSSIIPGSEESDHDMNIVDNIPSVLRRDVSSPLLATGKTSTREGRANSTTSSNNNITSSRRNISRSVSPPSGKTGIQSSWKMPAEVELQYRDEVLSAHYPKSDDEWMIREMSFLNQFTRIFPPDGKPVTNTSSQLSSEAASNVASSSAIGGDDAMEARNGDDHDDEDDAKAGYDINNIANPLQSYKPATYEEILYQVFLQDKRQALRLRCPLPNRQVKPADVDTQSLPPVEKSKGYLYNSMGANAGKGTVGWKLPSTINGVDKKESKPPTESQLAAAERLSKGLSVAEQQHKYLKNRNKSITPRVIHPSVVIDHRTYIPTINITNVAFNANIITPIAFVNSTQEMVSDGWSGKGSYNPSVVKQQQFRFDSKRDSNTSQSQQQYQVNTGLSEKRSLYTPPVEASVGGSVAGITSSSQKVSNGAEKEAMLRQLFPNWF